MKVTLTSKNYKDIKKSLILIPRGDEILIATECGKEIATLSIDIADKDVRVSTGEFKTEPTKDFYLVYNTHEDAPLDKNISYVCMDDEDKN